MTIDTICKIIELIEERLKEKNIIENKKIKDMYMNLLLKIYEMLGNNL